MVIILRGQRFLRVLHLADLEQEQEQDFVITHILTMVVEIALS